jgi:Putative Flp pilus-assembly TadE/G-like
MLVQVAMIAFAMFGVLAMVADLGYVTLTRVQMQNAADSAALEGMRKRNFDANVFGSDCVRRVAARDMVRWTFDDNLDIDSVDANSPQNFGAGPTAEFTHGDGSTANAYQTIGGLSVYKPNLGLNQGSNVEHGDMVSGNMSADLSSLSDPRAPENNSYGRADFNRNPNPRTDPTATYAACPEPLPDTWPAPPPSSLTLDDNAFLVRLRRSNETAGPTDPSDAFTTGPTLPLMFARGTAVRGDGASGYNPRTDGLTVRAAAIASIRPALRVSSAPGRFGAAPFALDARFSGSSATIHPDGTITGFFDSDPVTEVQVGMFVKTPAEINTVGKSVARWPPVSCTLLNGYGPVYSSFSGSINRVVGFRPLGWSSCDAGPVTFDQAAPGRVAASDATALLSDGFPPGIPSADLQPLMIANRNLARALLAPVLTR